MRPYLLLALLLWSTMLHAQMGFPVKEFGNHGKVFTPFQNPNTLFESGEFVLPLPDGKTIIVFTGPHERYMVRHLQDGTVDETFGEKGYVTVTSLLKGRVSGAKLQEDGSMLVNGIQSVSYPYTMDQYYVVRLLPSGAPDPNFGINGIFIIEHPAYNTTNPYTGVAHPGSLAVLKDNSILLSGLVYINNNRQLILYKLLPNGTPDNNFGFGGLVQYDNEKERLVRCELAIQEDGKIIVGGFSAPDNAQGFFIGRYLPNGAPDLTFGAGNGHVTSTVLNTMDELVTIALQPDGKILSIGTTPNQDALLIIRHQPNGELDNTFNDDGKHVAHFYAPGSNGSGTAPLQLAISDLIIQSNGNILIGGALAKKAALWRYTSSGKLDNSFYGTGMLNFFGDQSIVRDLTVQKDGHIAVAGDAQSDYLFARLQSNGDPDYTLAGTSYTLGHHDIAVGEYNGIAIQQDGKILAAGDTYFNYNKIIIHRYNQDGSLDPTFGENGTKIFDKNSIINNYFYFLELYPDGRILIAGSGPGSNTLYRLLPNGSPDLTFDKDGQMGERRGGAGGSWLPSAIAKVLILPNEKIMVIGVERQGRKGFTLNTYFPDGASDKGAFLEVGLFVRPLGATVLSNGKILIGSAVHDGLGIADFAATRLNSDYTPDATFGNNGTMLIDFGNEDWARRMKQMRSGRSILSGQIINGHPDNYDFAMAMFNSDGTLNTAFGNNGKLATDLDKAFAPTPIYYEVNSVDEQNDGKLLITGFFQNGETIQHGVGRLNADGTLDPTFGTGGFYVETNPEIAPFGEFPNYVNQTITAVSGNRLYVVGTTKDRKSAVLAAYQIDDQPVFQASKNQLKTTPAIQGSVQVLNNPAQDAFTLVLSLKKNDPVQIRIMDASGKVVESWKGMAPNSVRTFGASYRPGMYLAEVTQKSEKTVIKLVKQ